MAAALTGRGGGAGARRTRGTRGTEGAHRAGRRADWSLLVAAEVPGRLGIPLCGAPGQSVGVGRIAPPGLVKIVDHDERSVPYGLQNCYVNVSNCCHEHIEPNIMFKH